MNWLLVKRLYVQVKPKGVSGQTASPDGAARVGSGAATLNLTDHMP